MRNPHRTAGLLLLLFCAAVSPSAARQREQPAVPPAISALLESAAKAVAERDREGLKQLIDGNPAEVLAWRFRGTSADGSFVRRTWKAAALRAPGREEWLAVFWDYQPCESQGDHVHRLVKRGDAWKIGAEIPETETFGFRIRDHKIAIRFDLPKHRADFQNTVTFEREREDADLLQMRLSADFPVQSVSHEGKPVRFAQAGGVVYLAAPAGKRFELDLRYAGAAHHPGMFVGNYITEKEVVLTAYWYPVIARLPSTHSVTAAVPKGWTAIGQGDLVGRRDTAEGSRFSFEMKVPTSYFTFDAGPYHTYAKTVNGRTYQVYLTRPDEARARKQLDMMDSSFRLFEQLWGPYPWNSYTIVETAQPGWPGALEAYSFTTYGEGLIPGDNPHEWGHTWFGGLIPNSYLHDVWNESVTTYTESVYYRRGKGDDSSREALERIFWRRAAPGLERDADRFTLAESWDALFMPVSNIGYNKGVLVMQNLEETIGFDAVQKSLLSLRERFYMTGEAATWADVERAVNETTGRDYGWWFTQWVRRPGLARLSLNNASVRRTDGGYTVEADIVQTGQSYRLKVPVWLQTADGQTHRTAVEVSAASTRVTFTASSAPVRMLLDPEFRLPRVVTPQEAPRDNIPDAALVLSSDAGMSRAKKLDNGERVIKPAARATEAELAGRDLVLIGSAATNPVWARFATHAPFEVTGAGVTYRGRTHPGASAAARTAHPLSPGKTITWLTDAPPNLQQTGFTDHGNPTRVAIYAPNGDILDGELALPTRGPTVVEFRR